MKHTQGEWKVIRNHTNCEIVLEGWDAEKVSICTTGNWIGKAIPEMEANAQLIAAAPDMFEALTKIHAAGVIYGNIFGNSATSEAALKEVGNAIKKATI